MSYEDRTPDNHEGEPQEDLNSHSHLSYDEIKDKKPRREGEFIDKSENEDKYIIKLSEEKIYEVAGIAYFIWAMCDGEKTVGDIIHEISVEGQVEEDQIKGPIVEVLQQLQEAALISI